MELIADFHTHSKYSRGCSKSMNLKNLYKYGKIKGINIIGTGDFTHPQWFKEIKNELEPAEKGLFKLKDKLAKEQDKFLPSFLRKNKIRFILSSEISCIYSKNDRVRKMHNILIAPDFNSISKIIKELNKIGNLKSDGRPILGLDSKKLLEITYEANKENFFIPAHIWTPWFSMFGSKSGFDSIEEAFEEYSPFIKAIETGLSSDPFMNWRVKELKDITITSNSDAHSPMKLGREANILNCKLDYNDIVDTLKTNDKRMIGTIEFFPQEGKYHNDGHKKCNIAFSPKETKKHKGICPKCKKPLVVGVNYRVSEISDKNENYRPKKHKVVEYIIPLVEIIGKIKCIKSCNSKKVLKEYSNAYSTLGNEFSILRKIPIQEIEKKGFKELAKAISLLRKENISIIPGYDGVFGEIKVFKNSINQNKSKK